MNAKQKQNNLFVGIWYISEMELWDEEYINYTQSAYG